MGTRALEAVSLCDLVSMLPIIVLKCRAALGQVVSDTSGVLFGQVIERLAKAIGLPNANLRQQDHNHWKVRWDDT